MDSANGNLYYYARARHCYRHYNDYFFVIFSLRMIWPFCNLLNDISFGLISK